MDEARKGGRRLGLTLLVAKLRWVVVLLALAISATVGAGAARAIEPYVVGGVTTEAENPDGQAARATALAAAQLLAWQRLMDRLVLADDRALAPALTASEIEPLIASHEIESETPTAKTYTATWRFRFTPEAVRDLLAQKGLRFTEEVSQPVVILPVLGQGEAAKLWDDPNPWRLAWANHRGDDDLVPLIVPLGELEDLALVDAPQVAAGDERAMADLAALHGAAGVLVLQATLGTDAKTKLPRIGVKSTGYGPGAIGPVEFGITGKPEQSEEQLWQEAVETAAGLIQTQWKRQSAVNYGVQSSLRVSVVIAALQDWLLARQVLESSPIVVAVQVLALSQSRADIVIQHRGTVEQLQRTLAQSDLNLIQGASGWELRIGAGVTKLNSKPLGTQ